MQTTEFSMNLVEAAVKRLCGQIVTTPVLSSPMLDAQAGCRVLVKAESLQRTGAFKFRGALNKLLALPDAARARGVVAFSSGNHGHAVSAAAAQVGCKAVIVLPNTAPEIKIESCRWWGAEILLYDPAAQDRQQVGEALAAARGMTIVPPFDDVHVIAGQASCGVEFAEQCAALDAAPDVVIAPCSGGGLSCGVFSAMRARYPAIECLFVEPLGSDKMAATLIQGSPQSRPAGHFTLLDGLSGPTAGVLTWPLLKALGVVGLTVSDAQALAAMALAFRTVKLVLEPAGAAALAAVLAHGAQFAGKTVAIVASGGNVDPAMFVRALQQGESFAAR